MSLREPICIVAGNGTYPLLVVEGIKEGNRHAVFGIAHHGETNALFENTVEKCRWVHVGQIGKILSFLKRNNIKKIIFAGGITRKQLSLRLDLTGIIFFLRLRSKRDDALLTSLTTFFEKRGIAVADGTDFVKDCIAPSGVISGRTLTDQEQRDVSLGFTVAKALGKVDVGQSVIVYKGTVVAVEALEGTDALINRSGEITGLNKSPVKENGLVLVKCAKPGQELRVDRPAIGEQTVRVLHAAGGTVLAVEAKTTMLLEAPKVIAAAEELGTILYGV